ncbi:MAG: DUF7282 domain-containing protein [Patescibacteria group bacterium]
MDEYEKNRGTSLLDSMGNMKYLVFALVVIFILLLFFWLTANNEEADNGAEEDGQNEEVQDETDEEEQIEEETKEEDEEKEEGGATDDGEDNIEIDDQEAGDTVFVSDMDLTESRWVVIHEDKDGELGNILGARLFPESATEGNVDLLRETEEGKSYYAVLYMVAERENDEGRRFDTNRDVPLIKEEGEMKKILFSVE